MFVFDTLAIAFAVFIALYEAVQYVLAFHHSMTVSSFIRATPDRKLVLSKREMKLNQSHRMDICKKRYMARSLVFHQYHYWMHDEVPQFKTYPYAALALIGTVAFMMVGTQGLTAMGIGLAGGLVAFVSNQARNLAYHSDYCADLDADFKNLQLRVALARAK
jgi:hypothetical protein